MIIRQNIFRQIFEKSVSVKISPQPNFPLYGIPFTYVCMLYYIECIKYFGMYIYVDIYCVTYRKLEEQISEARSAGIDY